MKMKQLSLAVLAGVFANFGSVTTYAVSSNSDAAAQSQPATACATCDSSSDIGCDSYDNNCSSCDEWSHGDTCGGKGGLLGYGLIKPSDHCFDDFISPMTNPIFFEDPRTLTEMRLMFINHELPESLGANSIQAYAPQFRIALTDRLSFITPKGSVIYTQSPLLDSGFLDIAAGLKYNLYRDPVAGRLLSAGASFEVPSGSVKSFQGNGDGEFHFYLTGGTRIGERAHWLSATGLRAPIDEAAENRMTHWSNHLDYRVFEGRRKVYVFTEVNWFKYRSNGTAFPIALEGVDFINFGAPRVDGNSVVTQAVGTKCKTSRNVETGFAYEFPLSENRGIFAERLTLDFILRY